MSTLVKSSKNEEVMYEDSKIKTINNLLNSARTRILGLELLDSYLPICSDENFIECCVSWMQICCKTDGFTKKSDYAVGILSNLLKISANYSELKKPVSFFITTRFFDYFLKYFLDSQGGWSCAKNCFLFYRGACGPFQEVISKHLKNEVDKNIKISSTMAQCFALLPCLGGGGNKAVNYKTNWKNQVLKFVKICHSILNDLFVDVEELQEYDTAEFTYKKIDGQINLQYLAIQLYNYCSVLNFMLLNKYPAPKCIPSDLLLEMICRGLAVNPKTLGKNQTTDIIALKKVLPEVHKTLHFLLNALIGACGNQLLPYSYLICKVIKQTLEWTNSDFIYGSEKPFALLRVSAYETLCNWLTATRTGSCVETISKIIVSNAISDIQSKKSVTLLKESKFKQVNGKEQKFRRIDVSANSCLCFAALKALQFLIKYLGSLLKLEEHKFLQEVVVKLLVNIQNSSSTNILVPYSVSICRKELYFLLLEIINQSCSNYLPPTHFALQIFSRGQYDPCFNISQLCSTSINFLINIIHSQYDNGRFSAFESTYYNKGLREDQLQCRNEQMEIETKSFVSFDKETENSVAINEINANCTLSQDDSDSEEKISNQSQESNILSEEDSIITVNYAKNDDNNDHRNAFEEVNKNKNYQGEKITKEINLMEDKTIIAECRNVIEGSMENHNLTENFKERTSSPDIAKESGEKIIIVSLQQVQETVETAVNSKTIEKEIAKSNKDLQSEEINLSQDNISCNTSNVSSELPSDESIPKKRYFLRSKTCKASSEEPEEVLKNTSSPESKMSTTSKGLPKTPNLTSSKKRPRTRALSKLETTDDENELVLSKKNKQYDDDDDENIIETFRDSFIE